MEPALSQGEGLKNKLFRIILFVLILSFAFISLVFILNKKSGPALPENDLDNQAVQQIKDQFAVQRVKALPKKYQDRSEPIKYDLMGKHYIRVDATIDKVLENRKTYVLTLATGKTITATINSQTSLNDTYFDVDQNSDIVQIFYRHVEADKLDDLKAGDKLRIVYLESAGADKEIPLVELALIDV